LQPDVADLQPDVADLQSVTVTDAASFQNLGGYDENGNMVIDRNKQISHISYNFLNLPTEISFEGTNDKITYLYNAAGVKVRKTVREGDTLKMLNIWMVSVVYQS